MSKLEEVAAAVENGKAKIVGGLVQEALDEGVPAAEILNTGMIGAMAVVGKKFQNNEIFVPEMLIAARAMKKGVDVLKPYLAQSGVASAGKVIIGTVIGDLHDIGKNLVTMMIEGAGFEVFDLGVDVPPERFIEVMKDVTFRIAPITDIDAKEMIKSVKAYKLLEGARGTTPAQMEQIEDTLMRLSQLVNDFKYIDELDINPLLISEKTGEGIAVDGRIKVRMQEAKEALGI